MSPSCVELRIRLEVAVRKKLWMTVAVLVFVSLSMACAQGHKSQSSGSGGSSADAEKEVRAASEEYDRAMKAQDVAALEKVFLSGAQVIEDRGKVLMASEIVANARAGTTKYEEGRSEDVSVQVHGDTAIVRGTWVQKGTIKDQAFAGRLRYSTVYVKHDGRWLVISDQVTAIAQ
jgi:ketosteroid isomerase-like protein